MIRNQLILLPCPTIAIFKPPFCPFQRRNADFNLPPVVREVQRLKCIFYLGKLGTLCPEHIPNQTLATGGQSLISSRSLTVTWSNPLTPYLHHAPSSRVGIHYSMPSVLDETKEWLASAEKEYDFVDPEIGQMAKAAEEGRAEYGYLHIVSDNLVKYERDLSNERCGDMVRGRKRLMGEIQDILGAFFDEWAPKTRA